MRSRPSTTRSRLRPTGASASAMRCASPPTCSCRAEGARMSPLKHSKGLAARMGGWSANHWKTAVIGWFAFVALSLFVGMQVGTTADRSERRERRRVPHRRSDYRQRRLRRRTRRARRSRSRTRWCSLQSKTLKVKDPAFRAAIADAEQTLAGVPAGARSCESPLDAGHADLVSKDGHSALIQFTPKGSYDEAVLYIDKIARRGRQGRGAAPGLLRRVGRRLDRQGARQGDPGRARQGRADLDPAHDPHPAVRARLARRRR